MNPFDAVIYAALLIAVVLGFRSGFLRSMVTILGYLAAAPIALAAAPLLTTLATGLFGLPPDRNGFAVAGGFLLAGFVLSALLRTGIDALVGPTVSAPDRMAGAMLGAVRVVLLAVVLVLIFDRIIPPDREPAFLTGSTLRPVLSAAGQAGLQSLPPDIVALIDRLKQQHGL
jgi:membrane protein required for colicin V production